MCYAGSEKRHSGGNISFGPICSSYQPPEGYRLHIRHYLCYLKGRKFCGKKFLRNLFLRMKAPKLANFAEFIFADRSFYSRFAEFNFADRSFYLKFAEYIFSDGWYKRFTQFIVVSFELLEASISSHSSSDSFILSGCGDMKLKIWKNVFLASTNP